MTLEAHSHFELKFHVIMGRVQQIIEFSQFSVVNANFRRELWIYKIMTSVFDTHPPLIYVTISSI